MSKSGIFKKSFFALAVSGIFALPTANAQSQSGAVAVLNNILYSINALVWTAANYMFQAPPNVGTELITNYAQTSANQNIGSTIYNLNSSDISAALAPTIDNPNANLVQMATITAGDTVLPTSTLGGIFPYFAQKAQSTQEQTLQNGNLNLNFQALISPNVYSTTPGPNTTQTQQTQALNFIRFVSNYANPISNLNLNSYPESQLSNKQKIEIQNTPTYQAYAVQRRQLVALQSALLTNLYWIYSKRVPVTTLQASDVAAGTLTPNTVANLAPANNNSQNPFIPTTPPTNPSPQQIEEFTATWRINNQNLSPQWYSQMSVASPANVQREQLFILAEIEALLYKQHKDNERIIALLAINQLVNIQSAKTTLQLIEKQVQDAINAKIKTNAQKGSTSDTNQQSGQQQSAQQKSEAGKIKSAQQQAQQATQQAAQQTGNTSGQ